MRYHLDTEFIERPGRLDLISLALVGPDDHEETAGLPVDELPHMQVVNAEAPWGEIHMDDWLRRNVLPSLPGPRLWASRAEIRAALDTFFQGDREPEIWAWYGDYDWVCFAQCFGRMVDLPRKYPRYCRDVKQVADQLGNPPLPEQPEGKHDALADARHNVERMRELERVAKERMASI